MPYPSSLTPTGHFNDTCPAPPWAPPVASVTFLDAKTMSSRFDAAMSRAFLDMLPAYIALFVVIKFLKWLRGPTSSTRLRGGDDPLLAKQRSLKKALALEAVSEVQRRGIKLA